MKKNIFAILAIGMLFSACKKSGSSGATAIPYMSTSANSTWQYENINNATGPSPVTTNYTITSTNRDTTISGRVYHVYTNTPGNTSEYYLISGNDYYQYRDLPAAIGGAKIEALYLKDNLAVGGSWSQSFNIFFSGITVPITVTYSILEKGISKTVNGISYTDVITVKTAIAINNPLIPASALTTNIKSYYARKFGLIQSENNVVVNFMGINQTTDTQQRLKTADIK